MRIRSQRNDKQESKKIPGVYYFLGNIHPHVIHALPLYEIIGGTFVVLSRKASKELQKYGLESVVIDNEPDIFLDIDTRASNTIDFLNKNARVVLFFEVFNFKDVSLDVPAIMLSHGNPLKSYWNDWKTKAADRYTYIASVGPSGKNQMLKQGANPSKLFDVGLARDDLIIEGQAPLTFSGFIQKLPNYKSHQRIISYMPTYWGATSLYDTGPTIAKTIPEWAYLIIRPHPQTPTDVIEEYEKIAASKQNVLIATEDKQLVDLLSLYKYAECFIGDLSSVIADVLLTGKPVIFAYGEGQNHQTVEDYADIKNLVQNSANISPENQEDFPIILKTALDKGVPKRAYRQAVKRMFFDTKPNRRKKIRDFILKITS